MRNKVSVVTTQETQDAAHRQLGHSYHLAHVVLCHAESLVKQRFISLVLLSH